MLAFSRRLLLGLVPPAIMSPVLARRVPASALCGLDEAQTDSLIPKILDVVPASSVDVEDGIVIELTDIARELEHTGVLQPASLDEDDPERAAFLDQLLAVSSLGGPVVEFALAPEWLDVHGFDILSVDQIARFGMAPNRVTVLQGRFDLDGIRTALMDQGYGALKVDGFEVLNRGEDYALDLNSPIDQFWVGGAQNIALLDASRVAFAASLADIKVAIRTARETDDSLAADADTRTLFPGSAEPLTSALILHGRRLSATRFTAAGSVDVPLLPRVEYALFGTTPGGVAEELEEMERPTNDYLVGENQIRVLFADDEAATVGQAAIESRLVSGSSFSLGQSWQEVFGRILVEHTDGSRLVVVHLPDWVPGRRRVTNLVYTDDLGFLLWE